MRRVILWLIAAPYLIGVLSGWYADHPLHGQWDPDAFIHSGLWWFMSFEVVELIRSWRQARAAQPIEADTHRQLGKE